MVNGAGTNTLGVPLLVNGNTGNLLLNLVTGGTVTNGVISGQSSQFSVSGVGVVVAPVGSASAATYAFAGDTSGSGLYRPGAATYAFTNGTNAFFRTSNGIGAEVVAAAAFCWAPSTSAATACDTGVSRGSAADVVDVGNGTAGDTTGQVKAAAYMSVGTKFTSNAGCSETTLVGGATSGKFTAVSTNCTVIITFGNTATDPNGWACYAYDLTTTADYNNPRTSSTTTTLTIVTGVIVSSDVIEFGCVGY